MPADSVRHPVAGVRSGSLRPAVSLIAVFSLVLIAVTWWAVFAQARFERSEAIAAAVRQNANRAIALEEFVARTLQTTDSAMLHIAGQFHHVDGTAARPQLLTDDIVRNRLFTAVSVANAKGDIIATSFDPPPSNVNVAKAETFAVHVQRDTGKLYFGRPRYSERLGEAVVAVSRRINNPDGSFAGVVNIQMPHERFTDFHTHADVKPTDLIGVVGLDGIVRARRTGTDSSYGQDLSQATATRMQRQGQDGTYEGGATLDGIHRFIAHRRVDGQPIFVTSGVGRNEVLTPLRNRHRAYFAGAALLTVGIFAFAALLIATLHRRQKAASELAEANERLHEAQRIGQIGDWVYDIENGFTHWSDQLFAMNRRDPARGPPTYAEMVSYLDEPSRRVMERAIGLAIRSGEKQEYEMTVRFPNGDVSHRQTVAVPTRDNSGRVVRLHGTDQDISARKLLETLQAEIAHLSRTEAMNTMAATLAHEINQPLAAASNYLVGVRRLLGKPGREEHVEEGVDAAAQQIRLAGDIIRRIRDMVSNKETWHESAAVSDIVEDSVSLIAMANRYPDIDLQVDIHTSAAVITGDRVQIQQVLINLVRNACDAVSEVDQPQVVICADRVGHDIRVCVSDNGPGIPDSCDLFAPFSTSKESGLGLGLLISRTIVEAHGGRIWAEPREEGGTSLCFTIPLLPAALGLEGTALDDAEQELQAQSG
jgi:two-component system, LuxR family, sensor kinase FixL